jgi:hypothetical protein
MPKMMLDTLMAGPLEQGANIARTKREPNLVLRVSPEAAALLASLSPGHNIAHAMWGRSDDRHS